jgi:hypothetical protein
MSNNNQTDVSAFDTTKIPIAFSPNDFFYLTVGSDMPEDTFCDENKTKPVNCTKVNDTNLNICYQRELCKNRLLADTIFVKRNTHGESDAKLRDIYNQYMNEYMKSVNLGVGIILSLVFIYYNR